jgi:hypothetical protein
MYPDSSGKTWSEICMKYLEGKQVPEHVTSMEEWAEYDGVEVDGLQKVWEESSLYTHNIPSTHTHTKTSYRESMLPNWLFLEFNT